MSLCSVVGCPKPLVARGFCDKHYARWRRNGVPGPAESYQTVAHLIGEWVKGRDRGTGCWDDAPWKTRTVKDGYPALMHRGRYTVAMRLVLELDGRPKPEGREALHSCDNKGCLNPNHLRWGTRSENVREAYLRGLNPIGQSNPECSTPGCSLRHKSHYAYLWHQKRRAEKYLG